MKTLSIVLSILLAAAPVRAQTFTPQATALPGSVPSGINYQGRLEQANVPVNGTRPMVFKVFDASTGGNLLWTSATQSVLVSFGLFNTVIPMPIDPLIGGGNRFLEVVIDGTTMSPREPLNAVPYAMVAKTVEGTIDISSNNFTLNTGSSNNAQILFVSSQTKNVGLGTLNPTFRLHISSGNAWVQYGIVTTTISANGTITSLGGVFASTHSYSTSLTADPAGATEGQTYYNSAATSKHVRLHVGTGFVDVATGTIADPTQFVLRRGDTMTGALTIDAGGGAANLTLANGNVNVTAGNLNLTAGNATLSNGVMSITSPGSAVSLTTNNGITVNSGVIQAPKFVGNFFEMGAASLLTSSVTVRGMTAFISSGTTSAQTAAVFFNNTATPTELMRVRADGNVGIGTTIPYAKLSVGGGELFVDHAAGGTSNGSALRLASGASDSTLGSNQYNNGADRYARAGGAGQMKFDTSGAATAGDIYFQTAGNGAADGAITFAETMRLKQGGNVGIGTSGLTVGARLHVNHSGTLTKAILGRNDGTGSDDTLIRLNGTGAANYAAIGFDFGSGPTAGGAIWRQSSAAGLRFSPSATYSTLLATTPEMLLDASGNLAVGGLSSGGARLHVTNPGTPTKAIFGRNDGTGNDDAIIRVNQSGTGFAALGLDSGSGPTAGGAVWTQSSAAGLRFHHNATYTNLSATTPEMLLDTNGRLYVPNNAVGIGFDPSGGSFSAKMAVNGSLGVGTDNPTAARLQVAGNDKASGVQAVNTYTGGNAIAVDGQATGANAGNINAGGYFSASGGGTNYGVQIAAPAAGAANWALRSDAAAQSYFSGAVGVGVATPATKLEVSDSLAGATGAIISNTNTAGQAYLALGETSGTGTTPFYIQRQGSTSATDPLSVDVWNGSNGLMRFGTNNQERLRIQADGKVGINTGTNAVGDQLEVASGKIRLTETAGTTGSVKLFAMKTTAAVTCNAHCATDPSLGICLAAWTSAPAASTCATSAIGQRCLCAGFGD